jgi:hypothetical protein
MIDLIQLIYCIVSYTYITDKYGSHFPHILGNLDGTVWEVTHQERFQF